MSRLFRWSCAIVALAAFVGISMSAQPANAVVYCQYVDYPANCVVRPGVVLRVRPGTVGVGAPGVGVRPGTPGNRGGPVDRAGRR
jgi:hypothetical protein